MRGLARLAGTSPLDGRVRQHFKHSSALQFGLGCLAQKHALRLACLQPQILELDLVIERCKIAGKFVALVTFIDTD